MRSSNLPSVLAYGGCMLVTAWMLPQILSFFFFPVGSTGVNSPDSAVSEVANTDSEPAWAAPADSPVSSLSSAINGTGTYGFIFNTSQTPSSLPYSTYNWCNMPHVRRQEYPLPAAKYKLRYVEVIHRHHKRTPYASNTFPAESQRWSCSDTALFFSGEPVNPRGNASAQTYWSVFSDPLNPFTAQGFPGDCEFPQLTREGLDDAWQHGKDLYSVYHDLLGFLPSSPKDKVPDGYTIRVTNNVITSQVAGMVVNGMFDVTSPYPLLVQPSSIDSLEPKYPCPASSSLSDTYGIGSQDPVWVSHLEASSPLFGQLDSISGVDSTAVDWHQSWDHYFDNLSARQCHGKALPCHASNCVTQAQADQVYRLGEWEYSWLYRGASASLPANTAGYGVWVAELASHMREAMKPDRTTLFRHNVAHDGSLSQLLSILQIDQMVWPGMGAELVFELYESTSDAWFVRILWNGQIFNSSSPLLGTVDMLPSETMLQYFDDLVGQNAQSIPKKCEKSS